MKSYKSVTFKSPTPPSGRYRDDPLACATEEDSLLYSPTNSVTDESSLCRCYRRNRMLGIVSVLAVALGVVCLREFARCQDFTSSSLAMDLTDLPLLGAPYHRKGRDRKGSDKVHSRARRHDKRDKRERIKGRHRHHKGAEEEELEVIIEDQKNGEKIRGHQRHHKASNKRDRASDSVDSDEEDVSEEDEDLSDSGSASVDPKGKRGKRHRHHRGREASEEDEDASDSVEDESGEDLEDDSDESESSEELASGSVDEASVDPADKRSRRHKRGRHKRARSMRGPPEEDEVLSCEELMIGVFEQECIAAVGTSFGTFASAPTGDGGLVGIGLGGRRMNKFWIGGVDLELQSDPEVSSNSLDSPPEAVSDQSPAIPQAESADQSPANPLFSNQPAALAVEDGGDEPEEGTEGNSEEDSDSQGNSEEDSGEQDSEVSDDGPDFCMRTVTTSSEPGWISETSIAKYNEMTNDNSKIFWTWGGNTAVCSFKKLEGRKCRSALDKITRSFKHDDTVDLGAFSRRDLC